MRTLEKELLKTSGNLETPFFDAMFSTRHLLLLVVDKSGLTLKTNQSFERFFGSAKIGVNLLDLSIWQGQVSELKSAMECMHREARVVFHQTLSGLNTTRSFEIELRDLDHVYTLIEFKDYEELEESKVAEAKARLEASEQRRSVEELAAVISHDLRAPVANMAYLMSLFNKKDLSKDEFIPFIEAMQASAHRTLEAIDSIGHKLNFDIRERGPEVLPMQMLIDSVLLQFRKEIENTRASVKVSMGECKFVNVHKGAFKMILGQLLSNSLKFRKPDQKLEIEIMCRKGDEECIVEVRDNGLGIDMEENGHRIFGLFQTFHDHPDARGVGLYQVKNRLRSIGGEIRLDSKKGLGTVVTLNFKANEFKEAPVHY